MIGSHVPDDGCLSPLRMRPHPRKQPVGVGGRRDGDQFPLIRHIDRIHADQFTCGAHRILHRQFALIDHDADL